MLAAGVTGATLIVALHGAPGAGAASRATDVSALAIVGLLAAAAASAVGIVLALHGPLQRTVRGAAAVTCLGLAGAGLLATSLAVAAALAPAALALELGRPGGPVATTGDGTPVSLVAAAVAAILRDRPAPIGIGAGMLGIWLLAIGWAARRRRVLAPASGTSALLTGASLLALASCLVVRAPAPIAALALGTALVSIPTFAATLRRGRRGRRGGGTA